MTSKAHVEVRSPEGDSAVYVLEPDHGVYYVGRHGSAHELDIALQGRSSAWVSSLHFMLDHHAGGWYVTDNNSTNGTEYRRNARTSTLRAGVPIALNDGDEVLLPIGDDAGGTSDHWVLRYTGPSAPQSSPNRTETRPRHQPMFCYDPATGRPMLSVGNERVELTGLRAMELQLLLFMWRKAGPGQTTKIEALRHELIVEMWGENAAALGGLDGDLNGLAYRVRKVLGQGVLDTVRGRGLQLWVDTRNLVPEPR